MADKNMEAQISVEFEEATSRQSLNSGETINTLWSKVKRWLSDLKAIAFSGSYNDLSDTPTTATTDTDGLMSAEDKSKLDSVDDTYALKSLYGDTTINVGRKSGTDIGKCSTAEGYNTTASGEGSHAEGIGTKATGRDSHAEGAFCIASGYDSHAGGNSSIASGLVSFSHGVQTSAQSVAEVAFGKYNISRHSTLFSIGDGTADDARHNAFEITTTGGKLHDKDIATLDDIPTELPASNVTDIYSATGTEPVNGKAVASAISTKVDKISGKNLSTNDLTNTLKNNYDEAYTHSQSAHAPSSAQANVIETIKVNNTALTPTNKTVNITVPSNTDRYVNKAVFVDDSTATTASPIKMTLTRAGSDTNTITANIPKVSSSSAGVVPKGSAVSSQSKTTKFLREDGTWAAPSYTTNTDTKVTSVGNHYTPAKSTTKSASGGTLTDITNSTSGTQVVTGVEMDAKGHVTGVTSIALKSTDTKVTVDSALSSTSTNPVQNKVIKQAIDNKADKSLYDDTTINVGRKANTPVGVYSTAEGYYTTASGGQSHAEGNSTIAGRDCSHAEGNSTIANGVGAHAEGYNTIAGGDHSHAEGRDTTASGKYSHTEGWSTTASGICSHAGGGSYSKLSSVITDFSPETTNSDIVSAWTNTKFSLAKGDYSHSEGYNTLALELGSHAEGRNTIASGTYSHAEGYYTTASGENCSHAEGYYTIASGECSRAEGYYTTASSDCSHAEGRNTIASGICSHAEGNSTTANGDHSHTEGHGTTASGNCSYAGGFYTNALHNFEVAYGHYNVSNDDTLFSIGDGSADDARHNAFEITTDGGKLHDKDIATTDLIPTSLPANGGNADTVDGLHADNFPLKGSQVQFIPYNMLYYALNDKICLFSNNDDATRGIYFINNSSSSVTVCVLVSATAEGPVCQYGYGTNTYPEIQNTGENREWFTIGSIPTSPVIYAMEVPPGKLGYFGFYFNSASAYTTVHDIRCPYFNFF